MQTNVRKRAGTLIGCVALIATLLWAYSGRSTPPGLSALLSNSTNLQLTVTNSVAGSIYELYYTPTLDTGYTWQWFAVGTTNQTNFTVDITGTYSGFFRAESGLDRDADGIENFRDADPNNAAINYPLTVIIETPLNGSTIY
jgi:hypothetical protein